MIFQGRCKVRGCASCCVSCLDYAVLFCALRKESQGEMRHNVVSKYQVFYTQEQNFSFFLNAVGGERKPPDKCFWHEGELASASHPATCRTSLFPALAGTLGCSPSFSNMSLSTPTCLCQACKWCYTAFFTGEYPLKNSQSVLD